MRAGSVAAVAALALTVVGPFDAAEAVPPASATCATGLYAANSTTQLTRIDPAGAAAGETIDTGSIPLMTIATDPLSGDIYGFTIATLELYRVTPAGVTTDLGLIPGISSFNVAQAGFDDGGRLWLSNPLAQVIYKVDVTDLTFTTLPISAPIGGGDFAWLDGVMYASGSRSLYAIDPTTGTVTSSANITGINGSGSLWSAAGHLYIGNSLTNPTYGELTNFADLATTTPTFVPIGDAPVQPYDGASCASAPSPYLAAIDDAFPSVPTGTTSTVGNVLGNDTENMTAVDPADVTTTITDDGGATGAAIAADGSLTIPDTVPAGSYTLTYRICETANPLLCDTAIVTFAVTDAASAPPTTGPTLAKTGVTVPTPLVPGAIALLVFGVALVALRFRGVRRDGGRGASR